MTQHKPTRRRLAGTLSAALIAAVLPTTAAQAATSLDTIDTSNPAAVSQAYFDRYIPAMNISQTWSGSAQDCIPGSIDQKSAEASVAVTNYMRALVGLAPVTLQAEASEQAQAAALILTRSPFLEDPHKPPSTVPCFTSLGESGAANSNVATGALYGTAPAAAVAWITDDGAHNTNVLHRRAAFAPNLSQVGVGATGSAAAMVVFGTSMATGNPSPLVRAWPAAGYFPAALEPKGRWSATTDAGKLSDTAKVSVTKNGAPVAANAHISRSRTNDTIVWEMGKLTAPTGSAVDTYHVTITGVVGAGTTAYDIKMFNPAIDGQLRSMAQQLPGTTLPGLGFKGGNTLVANVAWSQPVPASEVTYEWLRDGQPVRGATGSTYELRQADIDHSISYRATANSPAFGKAIALSLPTPPIANAISVIGEPEIIGTLAAGHVLTAAIKWEPEHLPPFPPDTLAARGAFYQWHRNGVEIPGATSPTYTLSQADEGARISVSALGVYYSFEKSVVLGPTATVGEQDTPGEQQQPSSAPSPSAASPSAAATSTPEPTPAPTMPVTGPSPSPSWSDAPTPEATLSPRPSPSSSVSPSAPVPTEPAPTTAATTGPSHTPTMMPTPSPTGPRPTPSPTGKAVTGPAPKVQGSPTVGLKSQVIAGQWQPSGVKLTYQWHLNGNPIPGATKANYVPRPSDVGSKLLVTVTGRRAGYQPFTVSSPSKTVGQGLVMAGTPRISGKWQVGGTLRAHLGTWKPASVANNYWWIRDDGKALDVNSDYIIRPDDLGHTIKLLVSGLHDGYFTSFGEAKPNIVVAQGKLTVSPPSISGKPIAGSTLNAEHDAWGPYGIAVSYQWLRNGVVISGATSPSYVLGDADRGKKIKLQVTGSAQGYTKATRTSAAVVVAK